MSKLPSLPTGVTVFERDWLSSNNILIRGQSATALVDSGYHLHSQQTLLLLEKTLAGQRLDLLVNTHLHSDHCGGNAALQNAYPGLQTMIAPGQAEQVRRWDAQALSYTPTGQHCPQFHFEALLQPGASVLLGDLSWQIHAAPGHDPHSVILFEPHSRTLISADALWQNGFGVVFPELEGIDAFGEVAQTLDLIESLQPRIVIPGHGAFFSEIKPALASARKRLAGFQADPRKHIEYAAKVLLKFRLLEVGTIEMPSLLRWAQATPHFVFIQQQYFAHIDFSQWLDDLVTQLVRSGASSRDGLLISNG